MKYITVPGSFSEEYANFFSVVNDYDTDELTKKCLDEDIKFKTKVSSNRPGDVITVYTDKTFKVDEQSVIFFTFNSYDALINLIKEDDIDLNDKFEIKQNPIVGIQQFFNITAYDYIKEKVILSSKVDDTKRTDLITCMIIGNNKFNIYKNGKILKSYNFNLENSNYKWQINIRSDYHSCFYYFQSGEYYFKNSKIFKKEISSKAPNYQKLIEDHTLTNLELLDNEFPIVIKEIEDGSTKLKENCIDRNNKDNLVLQSNITFKKPTYYYNYKSNVLKEKWLLNIINSFDTSYSLLSNKYSNSMKEYEVLLKNEKKQKNIINVLRNKIKELSKEPDILSKELDLYKKTNKTEKSQLKEEIFLLKNQNEKFKKTIQSYEIDIKKYKSQETRFNSFIKEKKKMNEKITTLELELEKMIKEKDKNLELYQKELNQKEFEIKTRKEFGDKIYKLKSQNKILKESEEKIPKYEVIIDSLSKQMECISTRCLNIIDFEKIKNPKNESRLKINVDGVIYDSKHPKWRKNDSKILNLFTACLHDERKIKKLIDTCGWIEERHNKHIIYSRIINERIPQKFVCPTTPAEWQSTWVILKRLEEEKIKLELI